MRIPAIPIIKHGNKVNRKREIFRCHFLHLNSLSLRRQTFENCPHYSENSLPKKKLQLGENYESYSRILQSVPIILRHTLVGKQARTAVTPYAVLVGKQARTSVCTNAVLCGKQANS